MAKDPNRKTTIPIKSIPVIVEWLLKNCTGDEIMFMSNLARSRKDFGMLNSIFTRLTDFNIHEVFYEKTLSDGNELMIFRAAKRGEVAGLKAFSMACQAASEEVTRRIQAKKLKED